MKKILIGLLSLVLIYGITTLVVPKTVLAARTAVNSWVFNGVSTFIQSQNVGIGTTSPFAVFSVVGTEQHYGNYYHFGAVPAGSQCNTVAAAGTCLELIGNDNTTGGVGFYVQNKNPGTSAYVGYNMFNDLSANVTTNYAGLFLNSSTYSDTTFGTLEAVPDLLQVGNSMGPVSIQSFASTTASSYINFYTASTTPGAGPSASLEGMRLTNIGLGIGTTSPMTSLQIVATSTNATTTMEIGRSGQNKGSCLKLYRTDGSAIYASVAAGATAFTLSTVACGVGAYAGF